MTWWRMRFWIACSAFLLNALAPSISHALAAARGYVPVAQICSADGRIEAQKQWHLLADCGYCLAHGGSQALLPPDGFVAPLLDVHDVPAFHLIDAPQPLLALTAAPPRGPPSL